MIYRVPGDFEGMGPRRSRASGFFQSCRGGPDRLILGRITRSEVAGAGNTASGDGACSTTRNRCLGRNDPAAGVFPGFAVALSRSPESGLIIRTL